MAGYHGFSMSNNAVDAYKNGERPLSKWTKTEILAAIQKAIGNGELTLKCSPETLKKVPAKTLREMGLRHSSWHHTSNHYNRTDFYSLDMSWLESLTDEELEAIMATSKADRQCEPLEERWKCTFLEWEGTRKHPKATEITEEGVVRGDWFIRKDGSRKKTTANGFRFIEKIQ